MKEKFIEATVGQTRCPGEKQSDKQCEECIYFDRDLAADTPCGLCYESEDKYEWTRQGDIRPGEMELPDGRVCETHA